MQKKFGVITANHKVLMEGRESRGNHRYAVVVQDLATQWIQSYPCKTKIFSGDGKEFTKVSRADRKSRKLFTLTILWKFGKSCEDLSWNHRTSTPHRSETNGNAEIAIRRVKEGTSAVLLHRGYCYLRNIQDLVGDGKTLYESRFGESFKGPIIPC